MILLPLKAQTWIRNELAVGEVIVWAGQLKIGRRVSQEPDFSGCLLIPVLIIAIITLYNDLNWYFFGLSILVFAALSISISQPIIMTHQNKLVLITNIRVLILDNINVKNFLSVYPSSIRNLLIKPGLFDIENIDRIEKLLHSLASRR